MIKVKVGKLMENVDLLVKSLDILQTFPLFYSECTGVNILTTFLTKKMSEIQQQKLSIVKENNGIINSGNISFNKKEDESKYLIQMESLSREEISMPITKIRVDIKNGKLPNGNFPIPIFLSIMQPYLSFREIN